MLRCQGPDEPNSFITKFVITAPALRGKVVFIILVLFSCKDLLTSALFYKKAHELKISGEPCTRHVSLSTLLFPFFCSANSSFFFPQQEDLAKFGYRSERKVENFKTSLYTLGTCNKLWSKYGDFNFFFYYIWRFGSFFQKIRF